jgi:ribosome-associated protein
MADDDLLVPGFLTIPEDEIRELASRASGPGGQHVNKSNTRVTLRWSVRESCALTDRQRELLLSQLEARLTRDAELIVNADRMRSRARNRDDARRRIVELVSEALTESRVRRATKPSKSSKNRVKAGKSQRSQIKRDRRPVSRDSD